MTTVPAQETGRAVDPAAVEEAVARRTGSRVVRHETHGSVVFVSGDRAFKLRKPVRFDFADLREASSRRALACADAGLAEPLAPGLVIGLLDVVSRGDGSVELAPVGASGAIDVVVELRRFDEADTLRARIDAGTIGLDECRTVGRRIAAFHRTASRASVPIDVRAMIDRNLEGVLPLLSDLLPARERFALQRFLDAFLFAWSGTLDARAAAGLVIDGHGDLRAEHILIAGDEISIVDRLEYDELRIVDIADELAFLLMELVDLTGDRVLGDALLEGYRAAGGVVPPDALLAFFGVHRALVRAKVALLRAEQVAGDAADDATARAFHIVSVARRLAWRARGRIILLVTGPPASGKSTLAAALGEASRLPVLSSDVVRHQEQPGTAASDYSPEGRALIYGALGTMAGDAFAAIVDATFADEAFEQAFLAALPRERHQELIVVRCHAPLDERIERARRRVAEGTSPSDAGPEVVRQLAEAPSEHHLLPGSPRLAVDTQGSVAAQVDLVESWLDARLADTGE